MIEIEIQMIERDRQTDRQRQPEWERGRENKQMPTSEMKAGYHDRSCRF